MNRQCLLKPIQYKRIMFLPALLFGVAVVQPAKAQNSIELRYLSSFSHGAYAKQASEVVAHDAATQRLFVVNSQNVRLDVLDIRAPETPKLAFKIDAKKFGGGVNSVDVHAGLVAVAIEDTNRQAAGSVAIYDTDGHLLSHVKVGAMPDMLKFSHDGRWLLTADEGEPNQDYSVDPEGTVSIIDLKPGTRNVRQKQVRTVSFAKFNDKSYDPRIRVFGPNATPAQDFEPEYIAISPDSRTAWVVLQENNALAMIDIATAQVTQLVSLGFKNFNLPGNGFDASNQSNQINIQNWPVQGMYQPDGMLAFQSNGRTFLATANEGDPRKYKAFQEEVRIEDLKLDEQAFSDITRLQKKKNLGRLKVSKSSGDLDGDGDFDALYTFGARSFALWDEAGELIFESGSDFEQITAAAYPNEFNSDNEKNGTMDNRSDDRGPEPEGLAIAELNGRIYLFIGLERIGGVMVYDVTEPEDAFFVQYVNHRRFHGNTSEGTAGDLGPEGLCFIAAKDSPSGQPLLVVANEVSGTTSIFEVRTVDAPSQAGFAHRLHTDSGQQAPSKSARDSFAVAFHLSKPASIQIELMDAAGKIVFRAEEQQLSSGAHKTTYRPEGLQAGFYFCRILADGDMLQIRKVRLQ